MIKKTLLSLLFLLFSFTTIIAQNNLTSPYSRFGLGNLNNRNTIFYTSMGNIGKGVQQPRTINTSNPAAYNSIDTSGFLIDAGLFLLSNTSKNLTTEQKSSYNSISYITIGFTINKYWKTILGVLPFSDIGYKIKTNGTDTTFGTHSYEYSANGGLTQILWGNSLKINKKFTIGLNSSYLFGKIEKKRLVNFNDLNYLGNSEISTRNINGFSFLLGGQYSQNITNDLNLVAGITTGIKSNLKGKDKLFTTTFITNSYGDQVTKDTIENNTIINGKIVIPFTIGCGVSVCKEEKFLIGADFDWQNWKNYSIYNKSDSLVNSFNFAIGGFYVINPSSNNFLKKLKFRGGLRFSKSYLELKNSNINEYGINFGLSIPLRKKNSINLGVEFGRMGTTKNNLIQESFTKIYLGLQLWDNMYVRRKLD